MSFLRGSISIIKSGEEAWVYALSNHRYTHVLGVRPDDKDYAFFCSLAGLPISRRDCEYIEVHHLDGLNWIGAFRAGAACAEVWREYSSKPNTHESYGVSVLGTDERRPPYIQFFGPEAGKLRDDLAKKIGFGRSIDKGTWDGGVYLYLE